MAEQRALVPGHTFDADKAGTLPSGFSLAAMRQPNAGEWLIQKIGAEGYLLHRSDDKASGLALAIAPDAPLRDVSVTVRLRLAGGERAGGLVWRYYDPANYHAALLDLGKAQLVVFQVTAGNRIFLESEDDLELDPAAWHTLKVLHDEEEISVSLGGIRVFRERDRRYDRRTGPGRTGILATGASEVWFDNLRIEADRK